MNGWSWRLNDNDTVGLKNIKPNVFTASQPTDICLQKDKDMFKLNFTWGFEKVKDECVLIDHQMKSLQSTV